MAVKSVSLVVSPVNTLTLEPTDYVDVVGVFLVDGRAHPTVLVSIRADGLLDQIGTGAVSAFVVHDVEQPSSERAGRVDVRRDGVCIHSSQASLVVERAA